MRRPLVLALAICGATGIALSGQAPSPAPASAPAPQAPAGRGRFGPAYSSPQIQADGRVTFRLLAPKAAAVMVTGDVPRTAMTKGENGIWEATTADPVKPGAWRYAFDADGARVPDPRNTLLSPSQTQVSNLLVVAGDFSETRDVPHGSVSLVRYVARTLGNARREMYVYTPSGYERSTAAYPVLYLIHGGGDTAISWSTVGRANDILDNLLAEKKAVPMIVVMPSGWTPSGGQVMTADATKDPFNDEMLKDIIPFVDATYRTAGTPDTRALSGLSMGGIQTLNIGLHNLGTFRYLAVMSSGWTTEEDRQFFYTHEADRIGKYNSALKLFWWGWGQTDIARTNGLAVIEKFKTQGVRIETLETPGGHEWANWRIYLHEVAPKLFR